MSVSALGRLKNHKVPHLHPNSTMFMPLDRLQLKIYAFSGKFNVCSKRLFFSWIKICRDFTLQTQIFTQKYRSWLRFYSEFLRKKLAAEGSGLNTYGQPHRKIFGFFWHPPFNKMIKSVCWLWSYRLAGLHVTNHPGSWQNHHWKKRMVSPSYACSFFLDTSVNYTHQHKPASDGQCRRVFDIGPIISKLRYESSSLKLYK